MTRARDIADSGKVINYLDTVSSDVQTQLAEVHADQFEDRTVSTNTTLDADTYYSVGKTLIINNGITLIIPVDTLMEQKLYGSGKAL